MTNQIKFLRIKHGLTQKDLANMVGTHSHVISYAETHKVGIALAIRISEALNENVFDVLGSDVFVITPKSKEEALIISKTLKEFL